MPSTPFSQRLVLVSMSQDPSSLISNQLLLMKSEPVLTDNSSIQSNSSQERRTPPTTSPEAITPLERKSLISALTESESFLINALDSKVSLFSTPSEEEQVPVSDPFFSRDSQSIMVRNPSLDSPSIHLHRSPPPSSSHTTPSSPPIPSLSTPMLLS